MDANPGLGRMTRWRYSTPTTKGRWHETRAEAMESAVKAKLASKDEHTGTVYLSVLTEIESEE